METTIMHPSAIGVVYQIRQANASAELNTAYPTLTKTECPSAYWE